MQYNVPSQYFVTPGTGIGLEPNTLPPPTGPNPLPGTYHLLVTASAPGLGSGQGLVTINISQVATPVIVGAGPFSFLSPAATGTFVGQLVANNAPDNWSILSGDPLGDFTVSNQGVITAAKLISDTNNETLQVQAINAAGVAQALVPISWVAGAPIVNPGNFNISVPVTLNQTIGQMTFTGGIPVSWAIVGGNFDNYFNINNSGLITAAAPAIDVVTNLALQSQNFEVAANWSPTGLGTGAPFGTSTITTGATVAPDNTTTGELLGEDTSTNFHRITQLVTKAGSALIYTFSVFAKAQNRIRCELQLDDNVANGVYAVFDLSIGQAISTPVTFGTGFTAATSSIVPVAGSNGWYRCILTATSNTATSLDATIANDAGTQGNAAVQSYAGGGTGVGVYIWGAQLEQTSNGVSPYVPTTTATASQTGLPVGTYSLNIQALNGAGVGSNIATITASAPPVVNNATFTPSLPLVANQVVGTMTAVNGATSWAITAGNGAGDWAINNAGQVSVTSAGAAAITTPTNFTLTVQATNIAGSASGTCQINVGTAIPPVVTPVTFNIQTLFPLGNTVGTVSATNNPTSWAITSGDPAGDFAISNAGVITAAKAISGAGTETLVVQATNAGGSGSANVVVNWTSGAPVVTATTFNILTAFALGGTIGTVSATNSPTAFAITAGDPAGDFAINNSGVISAAKTIALGTGSEALTITATNSFGSGNAQVTVSWIPGTPIVNSTTFTLPT